MSEKVTRYIAVYHKEGDFLIEDVMLNGQEFQIIAEWLGYKATEPMYDGYEISGDVLKQIRKLVGERLPCGDDLVFYLEASSE